MNVLKSTSFLLFSIAFTWSSYGMTTLNAKEVKGHAAKEAKATGKGILELVREKKLLTDEQIEEILSPENMTGLDKSKYTNK